MAQEQALITTWRKTLEAQRPRLAEVMPKHLSSERLVRITVAALAKNPDLLQCTQSSIMQSVFTAAQLGLEPNVMGSCYLVPFKDECQLITGYRGLIDLCRRSGAVATISAHPVYSKDKFRCVLGDSPLLEHEPNYLSDDRGELVAFYAVAVLTNGARQFEVMTKKQVDGIKNRSRSSRSRMSPWNDPVDYIEMGRKTVVRRLVKYLPISIEAVSTIEREEQIENGDAAPEMPVETKHGDAVDAEYEHVGDALNKVVEADRASAGKETNPNGN